MYEEGYNIYYYYYYYKKTKKSWFQTQHCPFRRILVGIYSCGRIQMLEDKGQIE